MKGLIQALILECITALLWELIRNTRVSFDPLSFYTRLWFLGILIDSAGVHLEVIEWQA